MYQQNVNLKTLPRNHLNKLKALKFDFVEYKVQSIFYFYLEKELNLLFHRPINY